MTEAEMIDRVVAAMKEASYVEGLTFQQERRHIARSAIEAMREPTQAMLDVGTEDHGWGDCEESEIAFRWNAMIDAALK